MSRFTRHASRLVGIAVVLASNFSILASPALAGDCYVDPVIQYSGTATVKSAVFMRSEACVSGTMILKTLSAGTRVDVVGFTDGWFEVSSGGKRGWVGQQFLESAAQPTGVRWSSYEEYRSSSPAPAPVPAPTPSGETVYAGAIDPRSLMKLACPSSASADHPCKAVYYIGSDAKRHAFPNSKTYFTWYVDFLSVRALTTERLGAYALGRNVTYRPGARMVKFTTLNNVYAVGRGGVLRWVKTEEVARALYGTDWNKKIDDISDTFFTDYTFGADIETAADFSPQAELDATPTYD